LVSKLQFAGQSEIDTCPIQLEPALMGLFGVLPDEKAPDKPVLFPRTFGSKTPHANLSGLAPVALFRFYF